MESVEKSVKATHTNSKLYVIVVWECEERKWSKSNIEEIMVENFPTWKTSNHRFKKYYEPKQDKYNKSLT